jgi:hypothetical protein
MAGKFGMNPGGCPTQDDVRIASTPSTQVRDLGRSGSKVEPGDGFATWWIWVALMAAGGRRAARAASRMGAARSAVSVSRAATLRGARAAYSQRCERGPLWNPVWTTGRRELRPIPRFARWPSPRA